ncbi:DUF2235 domain-containing protein [Endozoicomonas sp. SM1973]|uniref:DUF2235 domain-containing protein n=1 Tax=Spartinivicinus marinus TaxID=2994442 RepID=A0A853HZK7_9GAMM|nr:DUF2235 domain-containing protein [Spartinivicinus marinus]MCX4028587.1 DUF2235 domain-containing protein [Spartinivicinus marinus]NYZ67150.1 DUF2235 domain-containing protein [Spartinivicinus marinus]
MSKNIVLCFDGTWNRPDDPDDETSQETNVRLFYKQLINKSQPKTTSDQQLAFYDEGVGCHWYDRIRGGISGFGLTKNILEGYYHLCHSFQKGDRVALIGFSRGAFTARSLAGLIYSCGLIPTVTLSEHTIEEAWEVYKEAEKPERNAYKARHISCPIEMIGVWDTVGSLGIPIGLLKKISDKLVQFHDTRLNPEVKAAYHALAIDEQRSTFEPTLWEDTSQSPNQTVEQVWFAGVHADIGGGYVKRHHSNVSLAWMISKAKQHQLQFKEPLTPLNHDISQPHHDSYHLLFGRKKRRVASTSDRVHQTVQEKINTTPAYTPLALVDREPEGLNPYQIVK